MVETKVKASTAAASLAGLALWALGRYVFKGTVPDVVASWVYAIVPALITFGAGYAAKHTNRLVPLIPIAPPPATTTTNVTTAAPEPPLTGPAA